MDVGEAPAAAGLTVPLRMHNLLLALAGRIDDSALTQAHELVARADVDEAAELTTGTLVAGGIPVRAAERRELAQVLETSRCDATLVDDLVVDELASATTHRFSADAGHGAPESGVAGAIERIVRVLPDVRAVHAVWRTTPAGAVSGLLPKRVVLVEVGPEGNPPAVAYRVDTALRRAGINAVVEVLGSRADRTSYHESAFASANPVLCGQADGAAAPASKPGGETPGETSAPRNVPARPSTYGPQAPRIASTRAQRRAQPETTASEPKHEAAPEPQPAPEPPQGSTPRHAPQPAPEQVPPPEPRWHSAESWQLAQERQAGAADAEPASQHAEFPAPEPWAAAFQEPADTEPETVADPGTEAGADGTADTTVDAGVDVAGDDSAGDVEQENRAASTMEMTPAEMAQLREALAEDPEKGRQIAASVRPGEVVEIPELDLDDPQLSERDRELLRELHAELAARERADTARNGVNGSQNGS